MTDFDLAQLKATVDNPDPQQVLALIALFEASELKVEWLNRKLGTVVDLAGAAHRWNMTNRDKLTTRAEKAEAKLSEIAEALKKLTEEEHAASYADPRRDKQVSDARARTLNRLDCIVADHSN